MDDELLVVDRIDCMPTDSLGDATATEVPAPPEGLEAVCAGEPGSRPCEDQAVTEQADARPTIHPPAGEPGQEPGAEQIIEALLFSADTPLSLNRLTELVGGCSPMQVRLHLAGLNDKYVAAGLSFRIEKIARGYQMMTLPRYRPWVAKLNQQRSQTRLSPAALETLSVVAYKQPVIRADVEAIRGVACGDGLNRLREMGLVRVLGRAEVVGRPLLYGTTRKFLDVFGLADLEDLPPMEALTLRRKTPQPEQAPVDPGAEPPLAASA